MNRELGDIVALSARHLAELEQAIARAVAERAGWETILALQSAARAHRRILRITRGPTTQGCFERQS